MVWALGSDEEFWPELIGAQTAKETISVRSNFGPFRHLECDRPTGRDCALAQPLHGLSRRRAFLPFALFSRIRKRMGMIAGCGTGRGFQMFDSRGRFPGVVGRFSGDGQKALGQLRFLGVWLTQRFSAPCEKPPLWVF